MFRFLMLVLMAVFCFVCAGDASANGGRQVIRQRNVVRQPIIRHHRQNVVVQQVQAYPVVQQQVVQKVYAQPVVVQRVVQQQQYCAPQVQQFVAPQCSSQFYAP